jgi:hypothetical protein
MQGVAAMSKMLSICAVLLMTGGLGHPSVVAEATTPVPPCKFTLERGIQPASADDADETWVLTCHHGDAAPARVMMTS